MALRKIVEQGDECLTKVCRPVTKFDRRLHDLLDDMAETLYDSGGDALRVMDQIGDENSSDSCWLQQLALKDAISRLTPRQREILALRYSEGKTQMEVSREIGISQAQVSRLEKGAIGEIKKNM